LVVVWAQKEEKELEKLREQERVRSGKELLAAKRQEDDLKLKRNLELRRIEKEEEARARERIKVKLGAPLFPSCQQALARIRGQGFVCRMGWIMMGGQGRVGT
jgi:hypothetical protein